MKNSSKKRKNIIIIFTLIILIVVGFFATLYYITSTVNNYSYSEKKWINDNKDKSLDIYVEKETGEILEYKGKINKLGYKTYTNDSKTKIVRRHIKEEWNEIFRENRISEEGKELYHFRKEKVERSFADSKQNHGYRYAMHRGLKKNQNYTWLICAAQNMKNISIKMEKVNGKPLTNASIFDSFIKNIKIFLKIIFA